MEEDIVPSRETLKWQEQYQRRSVLHRKNVGEKMVKKKKKSSMKSVSSLITQWPSSGLGLLNRKEEITSNHVLKKNKVQEPNKSLQKNLWLRNAIAMVRLV